MGTLPENTGKWRSGRILRLACLGGLLLMTLGFRLTGPQQSYFVEESSKLYIQGSSNVNQFSCFCHDEFPDAPLEFRVAGNGSYFFRSTFLQLRTRKLDCGHKAMNKDLFEALKADDFPYIRIELREAVIPSGELRESEWVTMQAVAVITIADVSKTVNLSIRGRREGPDHYHFISSRSLRMTDFKVTPPTPLLGLIKVNDQITIHMDLLIRIGQV